MSLRSTKLVHMLKCSILIKSGFKKIIFPKSRVYMRIV